MKYREMLKIAKEENQYRVELFQVNRLNTLFSDLVREQLLELVQESGATVIFNLENIRFIDSSGFDVLLEVAGCARDHNNKFSLCNITDDVQELMILMELESSFHCLTCEDTREKILVVLD